MRSHAPSRALFALLFVTAAIASVVTVVALSEKHMTSIRYFVERRDLAAHPSAARAYELGMRYFDSSNPVAHDVDRAMYFLQTAIALDPSYPYVNQQIARIQFLKSNFPSAHVLISNEIALQGDKNPSAYYIRGLIRGYQGAYALAAQDFEHYLLLNPGMWAAHNDHGWVLMMAGEYREAVDTLARGLEKSPDNAWLLNSYAIALYETGDTEGAQAAALRAREAVEKLTPEDWSHANPGNDPAIAPEGLETFRSAALQNLEKITAARGASSVEIGR